MRSPDSAAILARTLDLVREPERWCQGYVAKDADGVPISAHDQRAVRFCLLGAVFRAEGGNLQTSAMDWVRRAVAEATPDDPREDWWTVARYNNEHPHGDVVRVLERAIEMEAAGGLRAALAASAAAAAAP